MHIYETAKFYSEAFPNWYENKSQAWFYWILWEYRDKIILEAAGHDHFADLRTHSAT